MHILLYTLSHTKIYWVVQEYTLFLSHEGGSYDGWDPLLCKREKVYSQSTK